MNSAQVGSVTRAVLIAITGILGTVGYMQGVNWEPIIAGIAAIAAGAWGVHANTTTNLVKQAAESADVHKIVASPAIAEAVPSAKVKTA